MNGDHPIENLMNTAMNSIKDMIDVNTIIGEPIQAMNNTVIIPISKVTFGFAAGGSEFKGEALDEYKKRNKEEAIQYRLPFGGGSAAGVNITPEAFLVVQNDNVKLLEANHVSVLDKLVEYIPDVMEKITNFFKKDDDWENTNDDSYWDVESEDDFDEYDEDIEDDDDFKIANNESKKNIKDNNIIIENEKKITTNKKIKNNENKK